MHPPFDVIILGAGPAGAACALTLAEKGFRIALMDKASFPRDKVCGDALTQDVYNQLQFLAPGLQAEFSAFYQKLPVNEIAVFPDRGKSIKIPFPDTNGNGSIYTCTRHDFDNLLFSRAKAAKDISVFENIRIRSINRSKNTVRIETAKETFTSSLIIGADGANSMVAKSLAQSHPAKYMAVGLRQYVSGIDPLNEHHPLELYFLPEVLPAYVYIFPLADRRANIGTGMMVSELNQKKESLKVLFDRLCQLEPIKSRLAGTKPLDTPKGHKLPFAVKKRRISGERFMLIGDAAGLVNALTGEGIGHAIRSARISGKHALNCLKEQDFSANQLAAYDKEVYARMWKELKWSAYSRQLCNFPFVLRFLGNHRIGQYLTKLALQKIF